MQCFSPYLVKNKYTNVHGQNKATPVPCGKCINCKKRRSRHWVFRLSEEAKVSTSAVFLTLTYNQDYVPISKHGYQTLVKKDFQDFMKRLRNLCPTNKLKYYACGEYGTNTHRPHYHAILFNLPHSIINNPTQVANTWGKGNIMIPPSNDLTIQYVAGYVTKSTWSPNSSLDDREQEFSLMSKKMGISYLTPQMVRYYQERKVFVIVRENGELVSMPRYYKNKIFTKQQLQEMYEEYVNVVNTDLEAEINNIGSEYYKRQVDEIKALLRKTEKQNKLKRVKL